MSQRFNKVIYHENCPDGIAAAWVFSHYFGDDIQFIALKAGAPAPFELVKKGDNIAIVDTSFRREEMIKMAETATFVVVLDHHKSAERELSGSFPSNIQCVFDMYKSGCQLAWDYLYSTRIDNIEDIYGGEQLLARPWFIDYIADKDLWRWSLPHSREINKTFHIEKLVSFFMLDEIFKYGVDDEKRFKDGCIERGKLYLLGDNYMVDRICENSFVCYLKCGDMKHKVRAVETTVSISEVGNKLAETPQYGPCEFAVCYRYDAFEDKFYVSMRAPSDKYAKENFLPIVDLSVVSRAFGGGGHPKAAGFEAKRLDNILVRSMN
jgi:uncharacterized protein